MHFPIAIYTHARYPSASLKPQVFNMDSHKMEEFKTQHLGHLGLIATKIHELNLIKLIDDRLPISIDLGAKVSMGEGVAAMIFNGLGFLDSRIYLFPDFLQDKPVSRLFRREMQTAWFNDDAIGRALDEIAAYGLTSNFSADDGDDAFRS